MAGECSPDRYRKRLSALTVSALANATEGKGVVAPGLFRYGGTGTVAGPAVTADCDEGSLQAVWAAADNAECGAVLCIHGPGVSAYMGDLLATDLANRGFVAAVVDGYIRDRATLATMEMSFFARGLYPLAHRRPGPGRPMVPIEIGGVTINPGDWIVADDDGVVVIPPADLDMVLDKADENASIEEQIIARVKAGARLLDAVREATGKK